MTGTTDTQRRWDRAALAIAAYNERQPESCSGREQVRDPGEMIAELLCDLHHVADGLGLIWEALGERAERNYRGRAPSHVVEITPEGFQVLDTKTGTLRADVWSTREQAQVACNDLDTLPDGSIRQEVLDGTRLCDQDH